VSFNALYVISLSLPLSSVHYLRWGGFMAWEP